MTQTPKTPLTAAVDRMKSDFNQQYRLGEELTISADGKSATIGRDIDAIVAHVMERLGVHHYAIQSFSSGTAIEFMDRAGKAHLFTVSNTSGHAEVAEAVTRLSPSHSPVKPTNRPSPDAMAKLRDMVASDAKKADRFAIVDPKAEHTMDILARVERIERRLGL
jgi:hypothetical protein